MPLVTAPSVQSPRAYDTVNLTAPKLGERLAAGANATLRGNLRTATQDSGYRYKIHPVETAAGFVDADLTFGFEPRDLLRYGIIADGATDQTDAIIALATDLTGVLTVPYNVLFDRTALCAGLPATALLFDLSGINNYTNAGQTAKRLGILSGDVSADDSTWSIDSGHHPGLTLNNHGTAGTSSAAKRVVSIDWMSGQFQNAGLSLRGDRFVANQLFQKSGAGNFWNWSINSFAPWLAVAANYENWKTGEVISGTTYRVNGSNHYISASTGTTGATPPTHAAGTQSDGGVDWTWLDFVGRTVLNVDEYNRVQLGSNSVGACFEHQANILDPTGGEYVMNLRAANVSKKVKLKGWPTDSGGSSAVAAPFLQWQDGIGLRFMRSTEAGSVGRITDTGILLEAVLDAWTAAADGDTTPTVLGIRVLYTANSGATSITGLDDAVDGQEVTIVATDAHTTLVSSGTFTLSGSANQLLTAWSAVTFKKVPAAISNRWIEVSRSLK